MQQDDYYVRRLAVVEQRRERGITSISAIPVSLAIDDNGVVP
jgi:hypothetical protein